MGDAQPLANIKPWFFLDEYTDQSCERLFCIERDAEHLLSLLARIPRWQRKTPAYVMIKRGLYRERLFAETLRLEIQGIQEEFVEPGWSGFPEIMDRIVWQGNRITHAEQRLTAYREVIDQRASTRDFWDWVTTSDHTDELSELQGFYTAIDAAVLGFYEDIYGDPWIRLQEYEQEAWLPVAVLGHEYSIDFSTSVTYVPRSELLRARLLASLAHEIGHLKVRDLFAQRGLLRPSGWDPTAESFSDVHLAEISAADLIPLGISSDNDSIERIAEDFERLARIISEIHRAILNDDRGGPSLQGNSDGPIFIGNAIPDWWHFHLTEFLCDAISVFVAGPAALFAYMTVHYPIAPRSRRSAIQMSVASEHPPRIIRMQLMARHLRGQGFAELLDECAIETFLRSTLAAAAPEWLRCLRFWHDRIDRVAELVRSLVTRILPSATKPYAWGRLIALQPILTGTLSRPEAILVPRDLVNLIWLKRVMVKDWLLDRACPGARDYESTRAVSLEPLPRVFACVVRELNRFARDRWQKICP